MKRNLIPLCGAALLGAAILSPTPPQADACTRLLYLGDTVTTVQGTREPIRIVGRSLDWKTPIPTNIYVYPRGMAKTGSDQPGAVKWTSKYGAVYAVGYDSGITEGMNERGLVVNSLFCKGTVYVNDSTIGRPPMSMAMFVGWILDMNATTAEACAVLEKHDFTISAAAFDGGTAATLHWGITDATGDCAIVEFDHGKINIYRMHDMPAMANDPTFPQMTAINNFWEGVGGVNMLPGTVKSPDRYVRGYFFSNNVAKTTDYVQALAIARSLMANVSVPYHYTVDGEPNVSSTQWRSYSDINRLRYYFDIVTNEGIFYVDLTRCDLRKGAPVLKLDTSKTSTLAGDARSHLHPHAPFTPMY